MDWQEFLFYLILVLGALTLFGIVLGYLLGLCHAVTGFIPAQTKDVNEAVFYPFGKDAVVSGQPVRKAVFVGNNYQGSSNALNGCIDDVTDAKSMAVTQYGFNQLLFMTDNTPSYLPIARNMATAMFQWLPAGAQPGDSYLIWYSGHGADLGQAASANSSDRMECVVPLDFESSGVITNDDIYNGLLVPLQGKGVRLTAVFDCCYSAMALELNFRYIVENGQVVLAATGKMRELQDDIVYISGCSENETSEDVSGGFGAPAHGALSYALMTVLKRANYKISYGDLLLQTHAELNNDGVTSQHPQMSSSKPLDLNANFELVSVFGPRHLR